MNRENKKKYMSLVTASMLLMGNFPVTQAMQIESRMQVWETPEIIPEPEYVADVARSIIDLNGEWKFSFDPPENAHEPGVDFAEWDDVKVPGELLMQGYDIQMGKEYIYKKQIDIPKDFEQKKVVLRFEGVYSQGRVWVNGQFVGEHRGGFTPWDCDITDYVTPGEGVIVTVGVTDLVEDPSIASNYAHHNIGGILRDVKLMAVPKQYISRIYTDTELDERFEDALLKLTIGKGESVSLPRGEDRNLGIKLELFDPMGKEVVLQEEYIKFEGNEEINVSLPVNDPLLWDAEHPNLYTLTISLLEDEKVLQTNSQKVGFREITYGGKEGTDKNKIYVNGKEVKLRGTCRHDVSYDLGRSTTEELDEQEIKAYKEHNINYIRTSHYPPSKSLLEMCDKYGIYVESETAVCFQMGASADEAYFLDQFTEMVEYNRNHASVLIWSLGNESFWNNTPAFAKEYEYIKQVDPSRPIKFSWGWDVQSAYPTDISSQHYLQYGSNLGDPNIPVLHDEYAHIACYNLDELSRDNNVRNFWGESIQGFWEQIFTTDGALGGALWGGIDDVFLIPEGTSESHQSHSSGQATGYGEWGSVLDIYRREKPEAWLVKKAYSPIRIDEELVGNPGKGNELVIPIKNWFDHTYLNEVVVKWEVADEKGEFNLPPIAPHEEGKFCLPARDWETSDSINLKFYSKFDNNLIDEYNLELGNKYVVFEEQVANELMIEQQEEEWFIKGDQFEIIIDSLTGMIKEGKYQNETLITGGPYLHLNGIEVGEWKLMQDGLKVEKQEGEVNVVSRGKYDQLEVEFEMNITEGGKIDTRYTIVSIPQTPGSDGHFGAIGGYSEIGVAFDISSDVNQVKWQREGLWSTYPENHIGRNEGVAQKVRADATINPDQYGKKPTWDWKDDMRNFFINKKDDISDGIVTNDFKSMREYIYYYETQFKEKQGSIIVAPQGEQAARVDVKCLNNTIIDDRDTDKIKYTGLWGVCNIPEDYNGTETFSMEKGASAELEFYGTGVKFIGSKQINTGLVSVYVDGEFKETIDTYSDSTFKQSVIYTIQNLDEGKHTIKVETAGGKVNCIVVDAFEVIGSMQNQQEETKLIINSKWNYPRLAWGNYMKPIQTLNQGDVISASIYLNNNINISTEYGQKTPVVMGVEIEDSLSVGDSIKPQYSVVNGNEKDVEVKWYKKNLLHPEQGYSLIEDHKELTYIIQPEDSKYLIKCEVTPFNEKFVGKGVMSNEAIVGARVVDDTDEMIMYNARIVITDKDKLHTDNQFNKTTTYVHTGEISYTFQGDSIDYMATKEDNMGIVEVYIDDKLIEKVDLYTKDAGERYSEAVFSIEELGEGNHTIRIVANNEKNTNARDSYASLDAFIVTQKETKEPGSKLDGPDVATNGEIIDVILSFENIKQSTFAEDLWIEYDNEKFTFEGVEGIGNTHVIDHKLEEGKVRVLAYTENGFIGTQEMINLKLKVHNQLQEDIQGKIRTNSIELGVVEGEISTSITLSGAEKDILIKSEENVIDKTEIINLINEAEKILGEVVVGNQPGQYPQAAKDKLEKALENAKQVAEMSESQLEIDQEVQKLREAIKEFEESVVPEEEYELGDINKDKKVDVADLALAAYYYKAVQGGVNWEEAQKADLNKNGEVDITDLTIVANNILAK